MISRRFQSTRPIRGATMRCYGIRARMRYFNPRAPYGARRKTFCFPLWMRSNFNPRAPYGARLGNSLRIVPGLAISIHAPHTGRDLCPLRKFAPLEIISIHAPHTGRDPSGRTDALPAGNFNPRAPYGARLRIRRPWIGPRRIFQSTRPIRGATMKMAMRITKSLYFNPRAPYGARLSVTVGVCI